MTDAARRTARTVVQTLLGLAAGLPIIVEQADILHTAAGVTTALTVAAMATRIVHPEQGQRLLPKWLRSAIPAESAPSPNRLQTGAPCDRTRPRRHPRTRTPPKERRIRLRTPRRMPRLSSLNATTERTRPPTHEQQHLATLECAHCASARQLIR